MLIGKVSQAVLLRLGWTTLSFGIVQLVRLITNILLTRLLAPQLFGLMLIVNTLRVGAELLSDIGVSQNIVSNRAGDQPRFYDTAWTLQLLRGWLLGAVCFLSAGAMTAWLDQPELAVILPVCALFFILDGFGSTARGLVQKRVGAVRLGNFEILLALFALVVHVALALITPTIWALVLGGVACSGVGAILTYLMIPGMRHRLMIDPRCARQILVFGKWVFASSIIYFLAMHFDRLYFAKQISLAELGVYGIARGLADVVTLLAMRCGNLLLFPMVAGMALSAPEVRARLRHGRRTLLIVAAGSLATFLALSDVVVQLLYDDRYHQAAVMLPLLLLGVWFAVLNSVNESIILGMSRPAVSAYANSAKLLSYVVLVPLAFATQGFTAAILALSGGELIKYVALWLLSRKQHLAFGRDDAGLTILFVVMTVLLRTLFAKLGLTSDLFSLFPLLASAASLAG